MAFSPSPTPEFDLSHGPKPRFYPTILREQMLALGPAGTVARIRLSAVSYVDIRKWGRDVFDIETDSAKLRLGIQGRFEGAEVRLSRAVPQGVAALVLAGDDRDLAEDWAPEPSQLVAAPMIALRRMTREEAQAARLMIPGHVFVQVLDDGTTRELQ